MAIDPMLYEKISGRTGDPHSRLGSALAGSDAAKSKRTAAKEQSHFEGSLIMRYKVKAIVMGVALVVIGVVWVVKQVFG